MRKTTLLLSLLMTLFTTAMAEDPNIMELTKGKAYTIKFIEKEGFAYYNTTENNLKAKNSDNTASIIYHFVFTNAGTDVTGRQLYYISPKNAPEYFAYNTGSYNGVENTSANVGLTNDISIKEDKGKWYIFDQNGTHFITPAWKENGTYTRGGCCWNRSNTTDAALSMWGRGTDDPNFAGDNRLAITLVETLDSKDYKIVTGNGATGTLSRTATGSSTWMEKFTFTTTETHPAGLTFTASAHNMKASDGGIKIEAGQSGSSTYTLEVPEPYRIESYSFDVKATTAGNTITTANGTTLTISTSSQTFRVDNINAKSTEFTLAGTNSCNNICTNFIVKVYSTIPTGKYYRFKAYNNNNAYMVANDISARMTVNTNPDYAASIFYLNEKNQPVNYKYGVGIAETYNTGGIATTKETLTFTANDNGYILKTNTRTVYGNNNGEYLYHHEVGSAQQANVNRNSEAAGERTTWIIEEVTSLPVTITADGYATLYVPVALDVPSGVEAYTVTINGKWATLNKIESGIIPANTGVVLTGSQGSHSFAITEYAPSLGTNYLLGSVPATFIADDAYVLAVKDDVVGFYKAAKNQQNNSAFINNSHKAYLPASAVPASANNISFFGFRFGDEEETTGVEEVEIRNEKEEIFDLAGRRVSEITSSGIYIVNGKKVLIK